MKSLRRALPLLALAAVAVAPAAGAAPRARSLTVTTTLRPVDLRLPARSSQPFTVRDPASGVGIQVAASGLLDVAGLRTAGHASFDAVTPSGAHLVLALRPDGIEDTFTLPEPVAPRIVYDVALSHVAGLRLVENSLELLDADGTPRLRMSPPVVVGADGTRTPASVSVTGCAVDTNPAAPWGRTPTAPGSKHCAVIVRWPESVRYPLTVDPAWTSTKSMMEARDGHAMSLLADGRVLVTGGGAVSLRDAELFDPATETWAATGATQYEYLSPEQITLDDGRVLVVAGRNGQYGKQLFEELYYPKQGTWWSPGLVVPAHGGPAVKLPDGTVLVIGGCLDSDIGVACPDTGTTMAVLRYHPTPSPSHWEVVASLPEKRSGTDAALLPDGRVLVAGGYSPKYVDSNGNSLPEPTEIYDPSTNAWSLGPALPHMRYGHHLVRLGDGRLVVVGGADGNYNTESPGPASVDVFDPVSASWAELPATGRASPAVVAMGAHELVTVGGLGKLDNQTAPVSELLDANTKAWTPVDSPVASRLSPQAIRLQDGRALVTGGWLGDSSGAPCAFAELLDLSSTRAGDAGADAGHDAGVDADGGALTCGAGTVEHNSRCVAAPGANGKSGCGCRAAGHHGRDSGGELLLFAIAFGLCVRRRRR